MRTLSLTKPHLLIMVGIPGSGKTFFAEKFAETFNAPYVSFDILRKELFNTPQFSSDEQAIIGRVAHYLLGELFKSRQTIIYEGATDLRTDRAQLAKRARDEGYEALFIWVQTESLAAKSRSTKTTNSAFIHTVDQFDNAIKRFSPPHQSELAVVISGKHTFASQLKTVLGRLVQSKTNSEPVAIIQQRPSPTISRSIVIR